MLLPWASWSPRETWGYLLAMTFSVLPEAARLYFAVTQVPIYFSPWLLRPVISRLQERGSRPCPPVDKIEN